LIILLSLSALIGLIVSGVSGFPVLGWIVGGLIFIVGLPGVIIDLFVHGHVSYSQDRADDRQIMADINADIRADEHEYREDMRAKKISSASRRSKRQIIHDNRQIHYHDNRKSK